MRPINLSRQSERFLKRLPTSDARQIAQKLVSIQLDEVVDVKQLHGKSQSYLRAHSGDYRIAFRYEARTVIVVVIGDCN